MSWAWSVQPERIQVVSYWDDALRAVSGAAIKAVKAPTKIHYSDDKAPSPPNGVLDATIKTTWGYGVPIGRESLYWFKLFLLDDDDMVQYLSARAVSHLTKARELINKSGKRVLDIIADYLRQLWNHTLQSVAKTLGESRLAELPFTVVVTVPAIWKGYVRSRMQVAIKAAGILDERPAGPTVLGFVSEPEAAALATLTDLKSACNIKVSCAILSAPSNLLF